jgi:hypothetical protein
MRAQLVHSLCRELCPSVRARILIVRILRLHHMQQVCHGLGKDLVTAPLICLFLMLEFLVILAVLVFRGIATAEGWEEGAQEVEEA